MKRFFLLLGLAVLSFSVFSQVVIEESDIMQPGDTFLIYVDLNPSIIVDLMPGGDQGWDFSGLQNDQSNFACYAPSNDLEFIDEFPLSEFYTMVLVLFMQALVEELLSIMGIYDVFYKFKRTIRRRILFGLRHGLSKHF
jgi:hypothetical protein